MATNARYYVESGGIYQGVELGVFLTYLWCYKFERIDNDYIIYTGVDNIEDHDDYNEQYFG